MNRPNVLYVNSHDTGRYIQPHGHAIPTPHLQALAEAGTMFRQAYCCNPTCSASRAALLTGQYPHANGMLGLAHRGFELSDTRKHLQFALQAAGYHTALAGGQHITSTPRTFGYDQVFEELHHGDENAEAFLAAPPKQPFFLEIGFGQTHRAYPDSTGTINANYCLPPPPFPDTPVTRREMADFKLSAQQLDDRLGRVFAALDKSGLADQTLVICTTDHGIAFPHMKCNLLDGGIGVFMILRGPGIPAGEVRDGLVSHVDVFPTLCEYLGIQPPAWLQGVSFLPLVRDPGATVRHEVFAEVNLHAACEPMRCVRTARYKYIRRYDDRSRPVLPNCDDSPTKTFWIEQGWCERQREPEMFYDLYFDPGETANLIASPAHQTALSDLRKRMQLWMETTGDPLLDGPLAIPAGAILNDVDQLSPQETTRKY